MAGIYGSQIPAALQTRKINILEEQNNKLREEIRKMQLQQEAQRLQGELRNSKENKDAEQPQ